MRTLVLGSEGFIGGHVVACFQEWGHEVYGADLFEQPTRSYAYTKISRLSPEVDELLSRQKFDWIINAAGSGHVPYSMTHPVIDFEANSLDTIRILDGIRKHQPDVRYIHLSSAAVYGNPQHLPITEEAQILPLSPYGWHKAIAELLCMEYASVFELKITIVRPFSVYGPGLRKQMFWDLYQRSKSADGLQLFGTGKESRDYIFIRDLVRALEFILMNDAMNASVYNLASGHETTIGDVVDIYFRKLGFKGTYIFNGEVRSGDPLNWQADITRISQLGFTVETNLEQGLTELVDWIKKF